MKTLARRAAWLALAILLYATMMVLVEVDAEMPSRSLSMTRNLNLLAIAFAGWGAIAACDKVWNQK